MCVTVKPCFRSSVPHWLFDYATFSDGDSVFVGYQLSVRLTYTPMALDLTAMTAPLIETLNDADFVQVI
jgi:hypothetical protein